MTTSSDHLHIWARKVFPRTPLNVDHTWLTNYHNPGPPDGFAQPIPEGKHYWFCWGLFHSGNDKAQIPRPYANWHKPVEADMNLAHAICKSNVYTDPEHKSWSHAWLGEIYGVHGVCHQVANRILLSAGIQTNGKHLTVKGVGGWRISWMMFGPYGTPLDPYKWLSDMRQHGRAPTLDIANLEEAFDPNLEMMIASELGSGFDIGKKRAIQERRNAMLKEKQVLDGNMTTGLIALEDFAQRVNELMAVFLGEASQILTGEEFEQLFGGTWSSDSVISLVNPEVAVEYSKLGLQVVPKSA